MYMKYNIFTLEVVVYVVYNDSFKIYFIENTKLTKKLKSLVE